VVIVFILGLSYIPNLVLDIEVFTDLSE